MEIKITAQKHNILLEREEVKGTILNEATISKAMLATQIAGSMKKAEDVIAVKSIYPSYGSKESKFEVFVYNSAEAKAKIEPKQKAKAEKKAAEKPAEKK